MDFTKICRLCCDSNCRLYPIHEAHDVYSMKQLFNNILLLELSADDDLPQQICELCLSTLVKMHETIEAFRENERMLRLQKFVQVDIKEEVLEQEETDPIPTHELQVEIIGEKDRTVMESNENDLEPDNEELVLSDTASQTEVDSVVEEKYSKRKRPKKTKKRVKEAQSIRKTLGRPRIRYRDPNRPRLNDFKCYICKSDSLGTPEALLLHLNSHLDKLPYTCAACVVETVVIDKLTTLNIHMRMHENPHKCPHCDRRYSTYPNVETHINTYHLGENAPCPTTCDQCGKVCSSVTSLKHHQRLHTNGFACEICGKLCNGKHKLKKHIELTHEKVKKFECYLCHKMLSTFSAVQAHIKIMHSTKEVKCEYCGKSYPSELSLRYHLKKHEQHPNVKFSSDWRKYYTVLKSEEDGTTIKKCNLCGVIRKAIAPHMNLVHFPKEYRCDQCDMVFKVKKTYEIHAREHEHGKAYQCPICDKKISEKRNLIAHLRTKKHRDHPLSKSLDWLDKKSDDDGAQFKNDSDIAMGNLM
ncbi:zinc finger and BTB domain-containing protein 24-like [Malaya genurostris]|uniref:zinc finger and BTB domain-containing protein 24-like n=1 Tax=Malaya genurostris TaxID=325434 RepID=UPI0026F394BE|nr:zinc finger and BTB domain-containing protein 24-like [Malaya genurostris]